MMQQQLTRKKQKIQRKTTQQPEKLQPSARVSEHPYLPGQSVFGNHGMLRRYGFDVIQAKLILGSPNGKYEQEADRIAEQIMNIQEPEVQNLAGDTEGTKLLAHELTHVVQQHKVTMQIQKADDPSPQVARQDVVVIVGRPSLTIEKKETPEEKEQMRTWRAAAQALAPAVFEGLTVDEAFKGLKQHPTPIGKLYIISHADISGIGEVSPDGTTVSKTITDMLQRLSAATGDLGEKAPLSVDLLSCYGGGSPEVIARIGETLETERIRAPIQETVISGRIIKLSIQGGPPVPLTVKKIAKLNDEELKSYIRQTDALKHYDHVPGVPHPAEELSSDEKLNNLVSIFRRVGMIPYVSYNGPPGERYSVPYWKVSVEQREKTDEISIADQLSGRGLIEVVIEEEK